MADEKGTKNDNNSDLNAAKITDTEPTPKPSPSSSLPGEGKKETKPRNYMDIAGGSLKSALVPAFLIAVIITVVLNLSALTDLLEKLNKEEPILFFLGLLIGLLILLGVIFFMFDISLLTRKDPKFTAMLSKKEIKKAIQKDGLLDAQNVMAYLNWTIENTEQQIEWYQRSRQSKRKFSRWLRGATIVLGTLGALAPVIASLDTDRQLFTFIIILGYISLALAGAFVAADRLFGFSSGWIRYILAEFKLKRELNNFQYDLVLVESKTTDTSPQDDKNGEDNVTNRKLKLLVERLQKFNSSTEDVVSQETNDWVKEFQSTLDAQDKTLTVSIEAGKEQLKKIQQDIESRIKEASDKAEQAVKASEALKAEQAKSNETGRIHVVVDNATEFDKVIISLDLSEKTLTLEKVNQGIFHDIPPNAYIVTAKANKDGEAFIATTYAKVTPGGIAEPDSMKLKK